MSLLRVAALFAVAAAALAVCSSAWAHAHVSPSLVEAEDSEVFTLAVPTEEENATTTKVELTPADGFSIDSFAAAPGWKRDVRSRGSGEDAVIEKITWSGGSVPSGEATNFQFLGRADTAKTYAFKVRQMYSDGAVVDWAGPESSDTPAPLVVAESSLGGGGGTSTLAIVALVVGGVALVAAIAALLAGPGRRTLT